VRDDGSGSVELSMLVRYAVDMLALSIILDYN
jgi:hypothetical protein